MPYLVETVVPSTSGSRSRCTPWRETSAPWTSLAAGDLVDLVEEHDAVLLDVGERTRAQVLVVHQARGFLVGEHLHGFADLHLAQPAPAAAEVLEHALDLLGQFLHAGRGEDLHVRLGRRHLDFDVRVVEFAFAQLLSELLARRRFLVAGGFDADRASAARTAAALRADGSSTSSTRSSAASSARRRTFRIAASRVSLMVISTRSRTMVSTSRPT